MDETQKEGEEGHVEAENLEHSRVIYGAHVQEGKSLAGPWAKGRVVTWVKAVIHPL